MRLFGNIADRAQESGPVGANVSALEEDLAAGGLDQTNQHLHSGRLAGSVGAKVTEDFAGANGEADAAYRRNPAISLGQIVHFEHTGGFILAPYVAIYKRIVYTEYRLCRMRSSFRTPRL